jgi:hypothetical protein
MCPLYVAGLIGPEQKYYVSNLPGETTLKRLAATIKARLDGSKNLMA